MIGRTPSHYKISEKLRSSGMGEVYLAEDTKLSRQIALKLPPPEMAENPERRQRVEREAKAVAALNHPHIKRLAYVEFRRYQNLQEFTFDPSAEMLVGESVTLTHGSRTVAFADYSPDGEWLAFFDLGPRRDMGIVRTDGTGEKSPPTTFTRTVTHAGHPMGRGSPSAQTEAVNTRYG